MAIKAIVKALQSKVIDAETLNQRVIAYAGSRYVRDKLALGEGKFIPHCSTWINQRKWEDPESTKPREKTFEEMAEESRKRAEKGQ